MRFAAIGLDHRHIYDLTEHLLAAGLECAGYWPETSAPVVLEGFRKRFPHVPARDKAAMLADKSIAMIALAAIPSDRCAMAIEAMTHGKDVLCDKPGVTTLGQLAELEQACRDTGRLFSICFGERFLSPSSAVALEIVQGGGIGRLVQFLGIGPHRLNRATRPAWFFERKKFGGILNDLAIHSIDVARWLWGSEPIAVTASEGCLRFTEYPGFTDHAEVFLEFADSSTAMIRVDWLTPEPFPSHGDGRQFYECTNGTIEVLSAPDIHTLGRGDIRYDPWSCPRESIAPAPPPATLYEEFLALCHGASQAELLPGDGFRSTRLTLRAREAARRRR